MWEPGADKDALYDSLTINWNKVKPNKGHMVLVKLQELNLLKFLISQNIDNLHLSSGIKEDLIAEIHGNLTLARCQGCGKKYAKTWDRPNKCTCGGLIKSFVIKFGDEMPPQELNLSLDHTKQADVFIVIGSSLVTQPAGNLPIIAKDNGAKLIFINRGETKLDRLANLKFNESAGDVLIAFLNQIEGLS
jgi:NAD-dependent deacetylase